MQANTRKAISICAVEADTDLDGAPSTPARTFFFARSPDAPRTTTSVFSDSVGSVEPPDEGMLPVCCAAMLVQSLAEADLDDVSVSEPEPSLKQRRQRALVSLCCSLFVLTTTWLARSTRRPRAIVLQAQSRHPSCDGNRRNFPSACSFGRSSILLTLLLLYTLQSV